MGYVAEKGPFSAGLGGLFGAGRGTWLEGWPPDVSDMGQVWPNRRTPVGKVRVAASGPPAVVHPAGQSPNAVAPAARRRRQPAPGRPRWGCPPGVSCWE